MYIATQVAPEYQESPMMMMDDCYEGIEISGNKDFKGVTSKQFDDLMFFCKHDSACDEVLENKSDLAYVKPLLNEFLLNGTIDKYSDSDISDLVFAIEDITCGRGYQQNEGIAKALTIITGKHYVHKLLRGNCQGEWNDCYYPNRMYSDEAISNIECEYFNTGSEYMVSEEDSEEEVSYYVHTYSPEDIKEELAKMIDCDPENIVLRVFDGWIKTASYREIA